jgi:L-fuconolactonase
MHVDTHVHVISSDEERFPLDPSGVTGPWYRDDPCSVGRLLNLMDDAGVDAAVLVQPFSAYQFDNRYCAYAARQHPERCTSVAYIDLSADDAIEAMEHVVLREGMRGIRWVSIQEEGLGGPELWKAIADLGVPTVVTILADRLEELAETIPTIPPIPLALDHCGFADFSKGIPDALGALSDFPTLHLKVSTNALDRMAEHGDPSECVADLAARFGAHRLMWGSDYSQTHDRLYPELVEWGRRACARLSDDDRAQVLGESALSLWPELRR